MSTVQSAPVIEDVELRPARAALRTRIWFWIRRYGPAELACLILMLLASALAARVTDVPALLAVAAIAGATVGFYGVLIVTVMREQLALLAPSPDRIRRALTRSAGLLVAEFGVAELLDTLLIRPAALMVGVWLIPDPLWGLLAGKIFADVIFYAIAAGAFTLTAKAGLRDGSRKKDARTEKTT